MGILAAKNQVAQQRNAQVEGNQQQVSHQAGPLLNALVLAIGLGFLRSDHRRDVLQEVHAALLADSAVALLVFARRALVAQRGVAPPAEPRDIAGLVAALGAKHGVILLRSAAARIATRALCGDFDNMCGTVGL